MSLRLCASPFTLTHQLRATQASRIHLQSVVRKNGFQTMPRFKSLSQRSPVATPRFYSSGARSVQLELNASSRLYAFAGVATLGLGVAFASSTQTSEIHCEALPAANIKTPVPPPDAQLPPPPQSSVNAYELGFGTVCGICAGVFVKKGAKALAFVFGGVFVLLQYFGSLSLIKVDWTRAATRFENLFYRKDVTGVSRPPNVGSLFRSIIDFLTADFQQRASFVAGFALGLRIG